jgi:hypothetical protein
MGRCYDFKKIFSPQNFSSTLAAVPWVRCYDFKNIFAKKIAKKLPFFTHNKAKLCKNFDHNIGFSKTPIFSPKIGKNRRKL